MKLAALLLSFAVPLAACAGGSSSDDGADDTSSDSNDGPSDSPSDDSPSDDSPSDDSPSDGDEPDAGGGEPAACDTPASFTGGPLGEPLAQVQDQGEAQPANVYSVGGLLDASESPDVLQIELWDNYGAFAGAVTPGTYSLAGDELKIETCGLCVSVFADIAGDTGRGYFATGGTVTIDSISPNLKGSVANLTLVEWDGAADAPVAGGCSTAIPAASFDAVVEQPTGE